MLTVLSLASSCVSDTWVWRASQSGLAIGNPHDTSCSVFTTVSPAICPYGYTSACDASPQRDASETAWACCPTGYRCDGGTYSCVSDLPSSTYTVTDTDLLGNTFTTQLVTDGSLNVHSVRVAFHSSDLITDPFPTTSLAPTNSKLTESTSTPTAAATSTDIVTAAIPASNAGSLSVGATAGIGIGIAVGIFLLFSSITWLVLRQRKIRRQAGKEKEKGLNELPASEVSMYLNQRGVSNTELSEVDGTPALHEPETGRSRSSKYLGMPVRAR